MCRQKKGKRRDIGVVLSVALISLMLSACSSDQGSGGVASVPFLYSDTPAQGTPTTLSLASDNEDDEVEWVVDSQPATSNITLTPSADNKTVSFTATVPGEYQITVTSVSDGTQKTTTFVISPILPYDESKIEGNDGFVDIDELIGVINNQSWVYSTSLSENELEIIVANHSELTVIGYDVAEGLLIEYDETDPATNEILEELKLEEGVSSVVNRVHEGVNVPRTEVTVPDDGSSFNDSGDNWHLEDIGASTAWDYSTGNSNILIGVSDSGYDINHSELQGRYSEVLTSIVSDHGSAVAGAIGANTDNAYGMSGINWTSQMILGRSGGYYLSKTLAKDKVVTVNSSWAITGYLSTSFDPSNADSVTLKNNSTLSSTRAYRKLAQAYPTKLLVWSAGNGIGNGAGNSDKVYGVDGRHHSPALHYNDNGELQKQENVIFAAAMRSGDRLSYYSNYGVSVDIAAPTSYKSLRANGGFYTGSGYGSSLSGFTGTSASAPVVTGVASLIYSLYPGFTGQEVKDILIDSATEFVTERENGRGGIETLVHPIPILNAANALKNAQAIIDQKVIITDSNPDPFTPQMHLSFRSIDEGFDIIDIDWELQSSADEGAPWVYFDGGSIIGDTAEPTLDTSTVFNRIVATVTLRDRVSGDEITALKEYDLNYVTVSMVAKDTVLLHPLANVEVGLESVSAVAAITTGFTDANGLVNLSLKAGTYKVRGGLTDYSNSVSTITVDKLQSQEAAFYLTSESAGTVGSLSGTVVDSNGDPTINASIRISGGDQTSGYFSSTTTDAVGNYIISNISKSDSNGDPVSSFMLEVSAAGFSTVTREGVVVLTGKERTESFILTPEVLVKTSVYFDDFESGTGSWIATGFWNQVDTKNNTIPNTLVDGGYTLLAPDETGPQAQLPEAFSGDFSWWYGQVQTGSYIGTQIDSDSLLSGGTSEIKNSGQLVSPTITLTSGTVPVLRFRTWWEIESFNPSENGYDIMDVQVSIDSGNTYTTIKRINPSIDPNDSDRKHKPLSSGGFNRKPVWVLEEIDLSDFVGNDVTVRFNFQTNDANHNGFRGWILDDVEVVY